MCDSSSAMKRCRKCGEEKPATAEVFMTAKKCVGGLSWECKACNAVRRHKHKPLTRPPIPTREGQRWCPACEAFKPADREHFDGSASGSEKLSRMCKPCRRAKARKRPVAREGHKICGTCGQELAATLECFPPKATGAGGTGGSCRACHSAKARSYYAAHREQLVANSVEWGKRNLERYRAHQNNYRARKKAAPGTHTGEDVQKQLTAQAERCYWCRVPLVLSGKGRYHVDHRIPLKRGGGNGPENIVCACPSCNTSRRHRLPHEWSNRLL